ncbi:MAG: peptidase [Bradyrhizobium sp.]|nr:peptidase [Bradyrhizobium sp.]
MNFKVSRRWLFRGWTLISVAVGAGLVEPRIGSAADRAEQHLTIILEPETPGAGQEISGLKVKIRSDIEHLAAGDALLRMARVTGNVATAADAVEGISAVDARGPIHLTTQDDREGQMRRWIADRAVDGPVTVRYRLSITNSANPRGAAPPYELRSDDAAFSGAARAFLALPDTTIPLKVSLKWNLTALGKGAIGLSSFGVGDVDSAAPILTTDLDQAFFMGGQAGAYPARPNAQGFSSAWQGKPPFDSRALMLWTERLYGHYLQFFGARDTRPFSVFLRSNPINPGGGVQMLNSFVGTFGPQTNAEKLKGTLAHEMVHVFVGGLETFSGGVKTGLDQNSSWYSEGLAVFYERMLPLRFGQISPDAFLEDLNSTAGRYYTDVLINTPNPEIAKRFWADTRVRVLPYDRGSLYFATVDNKVRKATNGAKSLDDLVLAMLDRRAHGLPMDEAAWRTLIHGVLGQKGLDEFQAMLAGAVIDVPSDSFGPCFTRTSVPLRRYELGFDPKVLIEPERTVRGLIRGSAAEKAGLRNDDRILAPVSQDAIQADQKANLTLKIKRGTEVITITYLPRGETVDAFQWIRAAGPNCPG